MAAESSTSRSDRRFGAASVVGALEALNAGVAIAVVALFLAGLQAAASLDTWVALLLASKPLVDLTWRVSFFQIGSQVVNIQALVGVLVLVLSSAAVLKLGRKCVTSRLVVVFLGLATFSAAVSPDRGEAVNELIRLLTGMSFFFVAGLVIADEPRFNRFTRWFLAAVSVPVLLSFLQAVGVLPFEYFDWLDGEEHGRASGTYPHPLGILYFLLYAFPLALYLRHRYREAPFVRRLTGLFLVSSLIVVVVTLDRTAYIVFSVQLAIWWLTVHKLSRKQWIALIVLLACGLAVASVWLATLFSARMIGEWGPDFLRGRGANWMVFASSLADSGLLRWFIGRGASVATGFVPGLGFYASDQPHNDYIRILHAYGIIGLALYLMILVRMARQALLLRRKGLEFQRGLGAIALLVIPSILLFSITSEPMRYPSGIWYLFALASVLQVHARRISESA